MSDKNNISVAPPTVSVLMTTYNAAAYLEQAIDSICRQTLGDFEFIIVDDASTDATPDILRHRAAKDARLVVMTNEQNQRPAVSANRGFDIARGRYIARMDADDVSMPQRLAKQAAFLDAHKDYVFVGAAHETINAVGAIIRATVESTTDWACAWTSLFRMPVIHPSAMYRRDVVIENGLRYDDDYDGAADFEFFHRLARFGKGLALPERLLQYRVHGENVSIVKRAKQRNAARRAGVKNVSETFSSLPAQQIEALFDYLYGPLDERPDVTAAIDGLEMLEDAFTRVHRLKKPARSHIRTLAARWLAAATAERGMARKPSQAAAFAWNARAYAPAMMREAVNYIGRRLAPLAASRSA